MRLSSTIVSASLIIIALAALNAASAASAPDNRHDTAITACTAANPYQPVEVVTTVYNGSGYTLVWLRDTDGDIWMCHASNSGSIYAYQYVAGDLLVGTGPDMISLQYTSNGEPEGGPQEIAERVCTAVVLVQPARVIASRPDGLSDYSIFVQDDAGDYYLCNASGDAAIWAFAPIGDPLEFDGDGEVS